MSWWLRMLTWRMKNYHSTLPNLWMKVRMTIRMLVSSVLVQHAAWALQQQQQQQVLCSGATLRGAKTMRLDVDCEA